MPRLLKNIRLSEISLCGRGANQHSSVVLRKSGNMFLETFQKYGEVMANPVGYGAGQVATLFNEQNERTSALQFMNKYRNRIYDMLEALSRSADSINGDPTLLDKDAALKVSIGQFQAAVAALDSSEFAKRFAGDFAAALVEAHDREDGDSKMTQDVQKQLADALAAKDAVEKKLEAAEGELAKARLSGEEKAHFDTLPEAEQKVFLKLKPEDRAAQIAKAKKVPDPVQKQLDEQAERIRKQDEELSKMRGERELEEFTKQADKLGLPQDMAKHLLVLSKAGAEAYGAVLKQIEALKEQVRVSKLFGSIGDSRGDENSAMAKLNAKATELRKADASLTQEQAFAKAYSDPVNADLVRQYTTERRSVS